MTPTKRPISLKILLDFRDLMTVTLERKGFEVADVQSAMSTILLEADENRREAIRSRETGGS
jgi:hypothetical protein